MFRRHPHAAAEDVQVYARDGHVVDRYFTPRPMCLIFRSLARVGMPTDAHSGAVHQEGAADSDNGYWTAGEGERAEPEDDGHSSGFSSCMGHLQSR